MIRFICLPTLEMPFPGVQHPKFGENEEKASKHGRSGDHPTLPVKMCPTLITAAQTLTHAEKTSSENCTTNWCLRITRRTKCRDFRQREIQMYEASVAWGYVTSCWKSASDWDVKPRASFCSNDMAHELQLSCMAGFTGEHKMTEMRNYLK